MKNILPEVKQPRHLFYLLTGGMLIGILLLSTVSAKAVPSTAPPVQVPAAEVQYLSPYWGETIQQWSAYISVLAETHGLDPDFIAAVIWEESNGLAESESAAGAVGLMGVMPYGPGLEWRPSAASLNNPTVNLRWGVAILAEIVRQSGGDLYAALAAYNGGWEQVNSKVPREYAAIVLDKYARAIVVRNNQSPDIASQWTIAVEISRGNVPHDNLLILGQQPLSGPLFYGKHLVYDYVDEAGSGFYITGYAVPVALVVPVAYAKISQSSTITGGFDAQFGSPPGKRGGTNPEIIIACLPSLSRLRGLASTRWFAPSQCPSWQRP